MLGSLAGIGEIAKATFGESAASAQAAARRTTSVPPTTGPNSAGSRREIASFHRGGRVMAEMFSTLGTWNWLIFGFILMALELLAPGVFLFWLGLAALLVGLVSFVLHPSWQAQLLMFAVFAVAAVPLWRRLVAQQRRERARATLSQPPRRSTGRPRVHAGEADHRRLWHGAGRRYHLARRRPRHAGRQPRESRAGRRRQSDGGGGLACLRSLPAKGGEGEKTLSARSTSPQNGAAACTFSLQFAAECRQRIAASPSSMKPASRNSFSRSLQHGRRGLVAGGAQRA